MSMLHVAADFALVDQSVILVMVATPGLTRLWRRFRNGPPIVATINDREPASEGSAGDRLHTTPKVGKLGPGMRP